MSEDPDEKEILAAQYYKNKTYLVSDHAEAVILADKVFAPYGEKDFTGSRTAPEAKVRIRVQPSGGYRIILFKSVSTRTSTKSESAEKREDRKKQPQQRHRNDRKGKQRGRRPRN